jgi:transposase
MYYCGIDVAKRNHVAIVIDDHSQIVTAAFPVSNDQAGLDGLLTALAEYEGQVSIGLEATGHYWIPLYDALTQRGYSVAVINPLQTRAHRRVDIRKRKTDRWDAFWIADFLRFCQPPATDLHKPNILQLRELSRFRLRLVQQTGTCKRKILCILDRVFPEYEQLFSSVFLQSSRQLLQEAVTAEEFAEFDLLELEAILSRASRGRFGREEAELLQETARRSIGVSFLTDAIRLEMRCLLEQIKLLEEQVQDVETVMEELMSQMPQHITTIPGIGLVTGAAILAEIGDVARFDSPEKLVAYAGIDATVFKTGQFEGDQMRMSKRGSPYLRCALWQAATASLLHNAELKTYYDRKRAQGKLHGVALGAVCRKLVHRIHVVLREQRAYVIR